MFTTLTLSFLAAVLSITVIELATPPLVPLVPLDIGPLWPEVLA